MKSKRLIPFLVSTILLSHFASPNAHGQNLTWDSNGDTVGAGDTPTGTWGVDPFWNVTGAGDVTVPTNATTALSNDLFFSAGTDAVNPYTITVDGTQYARSISFQDGAPTLSGGSIILGTGGLTVNSSADLAGAIVTSDVTISGRTTFAIGSTGGARTLNLNAGTLTRNPGAVLLVTSGGNLVSTMTNLSSNTNGIAGPWVTINTLASTQYATFSGSNVIGLTGTAAATAADVTDLTGAFNYDVAAGGTLAANASVNTLRYTGAAGTITTSGTFTFNGLLSTSASALSVVGDVTIGSTSELVINNPSLGAITLSGSIGNNGINASSLIKTGSGALTLSGNNSYSGNTTIVGSSGGIVVTANNALGTTAGTTTVLPFGAGGNSLGFSGGINYSTAETIIGSGPGSNTAITGTFTNVQRGFLQSVSGNNTFAGAIQINAGGTSRIGVQDNAQLKLTGPITMASGTTGVTVVFRGGTTNGDYITLTNSGNSWDVETLIFSSNTGTGSGVKLGEHDALPTSVPVGALATAASGTTLDLASYDQEVNGLSNTAGSTTLKIINSAAATTSVLTLNTTADRVFNSGGLIQSGTGIIQVVKTGTANQSLQGAHTYTGGTLIKNGSITIGGGNDRLPVAGTVTLGDTGTTGKLVLGASGFPRNQTLAGLVTSGDGGSVVGVDATTDSVLTLNIATSNTFGGTLGGVGTNENELALIKDGVGVLTLTGANTYSGNTTVSNGTLVLADNAQIRFLLGSSSGVNNALSGSGTATLNGDFVIDTTAADALETGYWTLEDVTSLTGPYESTFTVVGFTDAGDNMWTKPNGPTKQYTFDETTGVLTLGPAGGFSAWQDANNTEGGLGDDHDGDGVDNGTEWFVGGNNDTSGFTALPGVTNTGGILSVTWERHPDYPGFPGNYGTDFVVETSTTLVNPWTPATEGVGAGFVDISGNNVKYTFPAGTKNFARLKITGP
jgi:autotransporter-associated beta strand protein